MNEFKHKRGEVRLPCLTIPRHLISRSLSQNPLLNLFLYFFVFTAIISSVPFVLAQNQRGDGILSGTNLTTVVTTVPDSHDESNPNLSSETLPEFNQDKATQNLSSSGLELPHNVTTTAMTSAVYMSNLVRNNTESGAETKSVNTTNQTDDSHIHKGTNTSHPGRIVNKCCPFHQRYENNSCVAKKEGSSGLTIKMMIDASGLAIKNTDDDKSSEIPLLPPDDSVLFKLQISMPNCQPHEVTERIIHMDKDGHSSSIETSLYGTLGSSTSSVVLSTLGYLIWQDGLGFMNTLPYSDFCMDQINETSFVALLCKPTRDDNKPLVRKCCSPDSVLDLQNLSCIVGNNQWSPILYNAMEKQPLKGVQERQIHYTYGLPNCSFTYHISPRQNQDDKIYTLVNGSLITMNMGRKILHSPDIYCIDGTTQPDPMLASSTSLDWSPSDQIAIICFPEDYENESSDETESWKYTLMAICAFISVFFLALTSIVYLLLWENGNIHSWLQFAYVDSCLVSYLLLGILQLTSDAIHNYDSNLCEAMGSVIHFSFLSTFFWMTSMNFDLWWTFNGCRPLRARSKAGEFRRFCFFALFSWGCAGVIAGTGLTLDRMYKDDPDSTVLRPRFGERNCYFYGHKEQLPYFYGPLGFLLSIDLIFFLHTVYSLYKLQQDTRFATQQSSRQEKKRFLLFVKLFVVMGVLWVFEVLSWTANVYDSSNKVLWENIFIVFDVINASQGVLIFIIFTCKPNICRQLEGQFKKFATFLEEKRGTGVGQSKLSKGRSCIVIGLIMLILPIAQSLRTMFSFCGRRKRSMVGRRHTSHTTTVTSTFDKSRKASDSSTMTSLSIKDPGAYELDITNLHI